MRELRTESAAAETALGPAGEERRPWWVLPVVVGLGVRAAMASTLPIMFDEAWTIGRAADVSVGMFFGRAVDASPPLSYLVYGAWGTLFRGIGWFRCLSIVTSLAAIWPCALAARRLFGESAVRPTVWILALWPLPLYAGWNIRYYALLLLLSALYLLCWSRPLSGEGDLPGRPVATSALEVLLFHTAYTSLPLIVALNGYGVWRLLLTRQWRPMARWVGRSLVVIVLCIPQFVGYRGIAPQIMRVVESYPSYGLVPDLLVAGKALILTELPYWHDLALRPLWLLPALVGTLAGVGLWRVGRKAGPAVVVTSLTILLVGVGIGSGLRRLGQYYFQVLPLVVVVIGAGLGRFSRSARVAVIALVAAISLLRLVDPAYRYAFSDTRAVARMVDGVDREIPVVYRDNVLRAYTDATQFARPRVIAILSDETAAAPQSPELQEGRWWSGPVVYDRPLTFQPATRVNAERWSRRRWDSALARTDLAELYLIVPVEARGTAVFRTESVERGRRAADTLLAAGEGAWVVEERRFPGTLVYHLRRTARGSE